MRKARRSLDISKGLIWLDAVVVSDYGYAVTDRVVLDTATAHTSLSSEFAEELGFPESKKRGVATWDTPFGPVEGYTVRLPALTVLGRRVENFLVGCQRLSSGLHVPAILGLDFFAETDLRLAFREKFIFLSW